MIEERDFELEEAKLREQEEDDKQEFYENWGKPDEEHYLDGEISPQRELAISIIEEFEDVLAEHNIKIPDEDRTGDEEEVSIYGTTYYSLEDKITEMIEEFIKDGKESN